MVQVGVGLKCNNREKRPACTCTCFPEGWVGGAEGRDCSSGRRVRALSSWGWGQLQAAVSAGKNHSPCSTESDHASSHSGPSASKRGVSSEDSSGVTYVEWPSITWELKTSFRSTHSALSTEGGHRDEPNPGPHLQGAPSAIGEVRLTVLQWATQPGYNYRLHCVVWLWVSGVRGEISPKADGMLGDIRKYRHL